MAQVYVSTILSHSIYIYSNTYRIPVSAQEYVRMNMYQVHQ